LEVSITPAVIHPCVQGEWALRLNGIAGQSLFARFMLGVEYKGPRRVAPTTHYRELGCLLHFYCSTLTDFARVGSVALCQAAERTLFRCKTITHLSSCFTIAMLHILWSIIVGFIAGWIAKAVMHIHLGFVLTCLLGIVGSIIGGLIARLWSRPADGAPFHPAGFIMSIIGAIILLLIVRLATGG
jgi:uncharacterized membrane protein YeaQ/YmgE (transglycosylase-associated protein family)